jgi:hypothetical protein
MNSRSIVPLRPYAILATVGVSLLVGLKSFGFASDLWRFIVAGEHDGVIVAAPVSVIDTQILESLKRIVRFVDATDLMFLLYSAIVFIIFMRHAYRNIMQPVIANRRYSPGWTIGAFVVPLANVVMPHLVMREIWQCSRALIRTRPDGHWQEEERPFVLRAWWPAALAASIVMDILARLPHYLPHVASRISPIWLHLFGILMYWVAAGITISLIWRLTGMQWRMLVNARRAETLRAG